MRVLVCKIHWPFICFCKPSAAAAAAAHHLYSSGPLKLENTQPLPSAASTVASLSDTSAQLSSFTEINLVKDHNSHSDGKVHVENEFKSCIRKAPAAASAAVKSIKSKRVQWIDNIGKELAEIKEFESCETGDTDEEDNRGCMCVIV